MTSRSKSQTNNYATGTSKDYWQQLLFVTTALMVFNVMITALFARGQVMFFILGVVVVLLAALAQAFLSGDSLVIGAEGMRVAPGQRRAVMLYGMPFRENTKFADALERLGGRMFYVRAAVVAICVIVILRYAGHHTPWFAVVPGLALVVASTPRWHWYAIAISGLSMVAEFGSEYGTDSWLSCAAAFVFGAQLLGAAWLQNYWDQRLALFEGRALPQHDREQRFRLGQTLALFAVVMVVVFWLTPERKIGGDEVEVTEIEEWEEQLRPEAAPVRGPGQARPGPQQPSSGNRPVPAGRPLGDAGQGRGGSGQSGGMPGGKQPQGGGGGMNLPGGVPSGMPGQAGGKVFAGGGQGGGRRGGMPSGGGRALPQRMQQLPPGSTSREMLREFQKLSREEQRQVLQQTLPPNTLRERYPRGLPAQPEQRLTEQDFKQMARAVEQWQQQQSGQAEAGQGGQAGQGQGGQGQGGQAGQGQGGQGQGGQAGQGQGQQFASAPGGQQGAGGRGPQGQAGQAQGGHTGQGQGGQAGQGSAAPQGGRPATGQPTSPATQAAAPQGDDPELNDQRSTLPDFDVEMPKLNWQTLGLIAAVVLILAALVWFMSRKRKDEEEQQVQEEQRQDSLAEFNRQAGQIAAQPPATAEDARMAVIRLYNELLAHYARIGYARPRAYTPNEFKAWRLMAVAAEEPLLMPVTRVFNRAYYGRYAPSKAEYQDYLARVAQLSRQTRPLDRSQGELGRGL